MITLCSISPEEYSVARAYCHRLVVPAKPENGEYSILEVEDMTDAKVFYQSLTEKEVVPVTITAQEIVSDLLSNEGLADKGVFALPKTRTEPTQKELNTARTRRRSLLVKWMEEGQRLYSQFGTRGIQHIPDHCKRAVAELGETAEWVFSPNVAKTECPVCGAMLRNLSSGKPPAICRECQSVLDPTRVSAHRPEAVTA